MQRRRLYPDGHPASGLQPHLFGSRPTYQRHHAGRSLEANPNEAAEDANLGDGGKKGVPGGVPKLVLGRVAQNEVLGAVRDLDGSVQGGRSDGMLMGALSFDYHIQDWIEVGLAYDIQWRFNDWTASGGETGEYTKHMITLHIGVDY